MQNHNHPSSQTQLHDFLTKHHRLLFGLAITFAIIILGITAYIIYDAIDTRRLDAESVALIENLEAPFDSEIKVSNFLAELKGELVDDFTIPTDQLGPIEVNFKYINLKHRERPAHFTINVIDAVPPIIYGRQTFTLTKGYDGELTDLMLSGDDLDDHPQREIIGQYDLNQVGTYELDYVATDASGNQSRKTFTLNIIDPAPTSPNNPPTATTVETDRIPFSEIVANYKTKNTKIGIDVSHWQGDIDWVSVKSAGVEFAFVRLGYQTEYNGEYQLDKYALANLKAATKANLPIGIYFYSYANSTDEAKKQAEWIIEQVKDYRLDLGITFDWENWNEFNHANLSFRSLRQVAATFIQTVEDAGYKGSLYGSKNYLENFWQPVPHRTWLAQYYDRVTYSGDYWLWQITDHGQVAGINGNVDIDIMYPES